MARHSPSEISSMAITASGSTVVNRPSRPVTNNIGRNAMTVVITDVTTDGMTSSVPSIAACAKFLPCERCT